MARLRSLPLWTFALALVVVTGAGLRAERAIDHGAFLSTDERAYAALGRALSHGYYDARGMNDPLHWPPGTPLLFAVARKIAGTTDATLAPREDASPQPPVVVLRGPLLVVRAHRLVDDAPPAHGSDCRAAR